MAHATSINTNSGLKGRLDAFFASFAQGFNAYVESRSRVSQIHALNRLSDEELEKRGLKRENIPAYVFRDLFYI